MNKNKTKKRKTLRIYNTIKQFELNKMIHEDNKLKEVK